MHTFYLEPEKWRRPFVLEGNEAAHALRVLRLKPGETIRLLDGCGHTGEFRIEECGKRHLALESVAEQAFPKSDNACYIAAAYTKAARRSWIMEKSVELEAGGVWFWQAERSQFSVPEEAKKGWREQLVAGAKQCGNPWLPEVRTFPFGANALAAQRSLFQAAFVLWEDEDAQHMLTPGDLPVNGSALFVLGPEGGLTPAEVAVFKKANFRCVSLGQRILRWETAALFCLIAQFWVRQLYTTEETR